MAGDGRGPAEREVTREARKTFRILAQTPHYLAVQPKRSGADEATYGIFSARNGYKRPVGQIARRYVTAFLSRGWLESHANGYCLGSAGEAWLRRQTAGADPWREQHQMRGKTIRKINGAARPVVVNQGESPLGWLRGRKDRAGRPLISEVQFQAGERLRADFTFAAMTPSVTANWSGIAASKRKRRGAAKDPALMSDNVLAAKTRFYKALDAVGPELSGVLVDVCCHLAGLSDTERARGWPQRAGKVVLLIALERLARHYGLVRDHHGAVGGRPRIRHWGGEDYRPTLDEWKE